MTRPAAGPPGPGHDPRWAEAATVAALFAIDPGGTRGVSLRALAGPVRDRWLDLLRRLMPAGAPLRRVPLHITDGNLLGGLDLAATLQAGRPVAARGVLAEAHGGAVLLAMAERLPAGTAARLAAVLDHGEVRVERDGFAARSDASLGVVALDEGIEEDERPPDALLDRLSFLLDLTGIAARDAGDLSIDAREIAAARALLPSVATPDRVLEAICATAMALGVHSARAPLLALRVARAAAALDGRATVSEEDASLAARLVLAPRATQVPASQEETEEAPPEEPDQPDQQASAEDQTSPDPPPEQPEQDTAADKPLEDVVLAAAKAAIPEGLLAKLMEGLGNRTWAAAQGRAGAMQTGGTRGRPAGVRRGEPKAGARLNVIETLRAAAPWQPLRRQARLTGSAPDARVEVRKDDMRVNRIKRRSQTATIFLVDASGSSAFQRLAEAKGAVELLLADCYVRRDQVALIAFRRQEAELLLPPTRSLVRTKRCLAELPGGGGTPLAAGLDAAAALAGSLARKGVTPTVVILTDGRANVSRDGTKGRGGKAEADATDAAKTLRAQGTRALLVDTSAQPSEAARRIAGEMGALYIPLPYADAARLSTVVRAATARPEGVTR